MRPGPVDPQASSGSLSPDAVNGAGVRRALAPSPELEGPIRNHIAGELGAVLPRDGLRDRYYDAVVLGSRSTDVLRTLLRYERPSGPVVDVGSGLGTLVLLANRLGVEALGIEPDRGALALARARADEAGLPAERCFRPGIGERLPLGDAECSAVVLHDVLEHVVDWRAVLRECTRVLGPGGLLYVKGPSYSTRFFEPHYRLPWLPLLPAALARRYLAACGRDTAYFEHLGYRRRGPVLRELRGLGLQLSFPRVDKLRQPALINRHWVRRLARAASDGGGPPRRAVRVLAENPLQATIDVVGRKSPAGP